MEQIYYGIAIVVYSVFIIRFILSWIGGDFDLDVDLDLGDVISFKGFTHFLMGMSGWLSTKSLITHNIEWYDYLIGFILGLIFVVILFYLYKFMFKLEHKPSILKDEDLVGHSGKIYLLEYYGAGDEKYHYVVTVDNGVGTVEVDGVSNEVFRVGDIVLLTNYDGAYYTLK